MFYADALKKGISNTSSGPHSSPSNTETRKNRGNVENGFAQQKDATQQKNAFATQQKKSSRPSSTGNKHIFHVDAGINLSHRNFHTKIPKVVRDAVQNNCRRFIVISSSPADAERVVEIVREHNRNSGGEYKLYCTVGVHPHEAERTLQNERWLSELDRLISVNRDIVLAVGECGLDYDRMFSPKEQQIDVFRQQIDLARRHSLPLYMHERMARDDFIAILKEENARELGGLVHCFTGDGNTAKMYLEEGFFLGITGWVCDDVRNSDLISALKTSIPIDRLLIETDAPYLMPKDLPRKPYYHGSHHIPHISTKVANLLSVRRDELTSQIQRNAKKVFGDRFE